MGYKLMFNKSVQFAIAQEGAQRADENVLDGALAQYLEGLLYRGTTIGLC